MFGGRAWERTTDADGTPGQWYLHLFAPEQPDWNWENPAVADEFDSILRFWFDRGIDGFRIDVANSMAKAPGLPDLDVDADGRPLATTLTGTPYMNQPHVHDILRRWRTVADSYADTELGARVFVSEAWVTPAAELAKYVRPDELHTTFNFDALMCEWTAESQRNVIDLTLGATGAVGAPATWVLANHDTIRVGHPLRAPDHRRPLHARRDGHGVLRRRRQGARRRDRPRARPQAGPRRGAARARPARRRLRLPGRRARPRRGRGPARRRAAGPDLGAVEPHVPRPRRLPCADPVVGRARRRSGSDPPTRRRGSPSPTGGPRCTAAAQDADPASHLNLYRAALAERRRNPALGDGTLTWDDDVPADVLSFTREPGFRCIVNFGPEPLPAPRRRRRCSSTSATPVPRTIGPDEAVWLAV